MNKLYNLTYPQKSILLTEQFYKNTPVNNICGSAIIKNVVNFEVLKEAINQVIKDNDDLRIHLFMKKNDIMQYIVDFEKIDIEIIELENEEEIENIEKSLMEKVFSIFDSMLFEIKIFRFKDNTGGFTINIHHIISDGWSLGLFCRKIMKAYSNIMNNVDEENLVNVSYTEYIQKENEYIDSDKFEKDKKYWSEVFKEIPTPAILPVDTIETNSRVSSIGERLMFSISKSKMKLILEFCSKNKVSPFNFLVAIYYIYISKILNLKDFTIGTPILNRLNFKEKNTIGMFINVVPLRIQIDTQRSFAYFVNSIAENTISSLRHQRYPYKLILEDLRKKDPSIPNLYNIVLSYQITKANNETEYDYTTRWAFNNSASDDLTIQFYDLDEQGSLDISYDFKKIKYSRNYIKEMHFRIMEIMNQVLENPDILYEDIDIITPSEKEMILNEFNSTELEYDKNKTVIKSFKEQVKVAPNKIAVISNEKEITYKELDDKSDILASYLISKGVNYKDIIGIMVNRSLEMAIGLLAILKAGGTYLPIDPTYPKDRIQYMLEDSKAKLLLVNKKNNIDINKIDISLNSDVYNFKSQKINIKLKPNDLIYLIYTSGSTGKPKGVMLTHKNITNFLLGVKNIIDFNPSKTMVSVTTICFDIFVLEFWGALTSGMTLVLTNEIEQNNQKKLNELCLKYDVNMIQTTPSRFLNLTQDEENIQFMKKMTDIMVGGESLTVALLDKLFSITKANIYNMYGPTETAVWSTVKKITSKDNITIGRPIANTKCYILDSNKKILPPNIPGELYIGGDGVSNGYYNKEELTSEKFIKSPFNNKDILYNTNDLAYFNKNGEIVHLGRTDFQVKIRGYRIELGEIENKIMELPEISNAVVISDKNNKYLICYYVSNQEIDEEQISNYLLKDLPNYMVPSVFYRLEKFPFTPNGKLDRKKLPKIKQEEDNIELAKTRTEKLLSKIISEIVGQDEIDINAPFISIGLDSLGIIEAQTKLLKYNYILNTQVFYRYHNIKTLAANIDNNVYTYKEHDAQVPIQFRHKYDEILSKIQNKTFKEDILGNVFLTGANGFIGIHILNELLKTTDIKVYCLVRGSSIEIANNRLIDKYKFYFNEDITDLINDRIFIFNGAINKKDIGLTKTNLKNITENITTIIHTAAKVQHYGDFDEFYQINTLGTKNIAEFAFENKKRLIHISSISVSGNYLVKQDNRQLEFTENNLYIGQKYTDNVYVNTKFEAEKEVLNLMEKGLVAQIHRIGILAGRFSDGVFQQNIGDNAFYSRIKSITLIGCVSEEILDQKIEFTPVDICTKSIVSLAKNNICDNKIFHLYNHNFIEIRDVIEILKSYGVKIDILSKKDFNNRLIEFSERNKAILLGIINDIDSSENSMYINYNYSVNIKSEYTQKYLHLLKSDWNETNKTYIKKLVNYMREVRFI